MPQDGVDALGSARRWLRKLPGLHGGEDARRDLDVVDRRVELARDDATGGIDLERDRDIAVQWVRAFALRELGGVITGDE